MERKPYSTAAILLGWTAANALGVLAVAALSLISSLTTINGRLVSSLMIGLPIGVAQWLALRRVARVSILWVLTVSAGLLVGVAAAPILGGLPGLQDDESVLALTVAYVVIGLLIGAAQWVFLRNYFTRTLIWPISSAIGLGLGTGVVLATGLIQASGLVPIMLVLVVYSVATGATISWLQTPPARMANDLIGMS
jgi:hypothetical protein